MLDVDRRGRILIILHWKIRRSLRLQYLEGGGLKVLASQPILGCIMEVVTEKRVRRLHVARVFSCRVRFIC